jgi:hypothetical protein
MAALVSPGAASAFIMQVHPLAEGLHALLTLLAEQEAAPDALTAQWLLGLSQDRVADLQAFRQGLRNLVLEEGVLSALLDAASLHQRGVWLVRQWLLHSAEVWGLDVEQAA